jgi:hypothetical protein
MQDYAPIEDRPSAGSAPKGPSGRMTVAYFAFVGIASIIPAALLEESVARPADAAPFFAFFWLFLSVGALLIGWRLGTFKRSLLIAAVCVVAAVTAWKFGFMGLSILALTLIIGATTMKSFIRSRDK